MGVMGNMGFFFYFFTFFTLLPFLLFYLFYFFTSLPFYFYFSASTMSFLLARHAGMVLLSTLSTRQKSKAHA